MVHATAIKHLDVHGKALYYLKLTNGTDEHYVNVGQKTFETVIKLQFESYEEENQTETTATMAGTTESKRPSKTRNTGKSLENLERFIGFFGSGGKTGKRFQIS